MFHLLKCDLIFIRKKLLKTKVSLLAQKVAFYYLVSLLAVGELKKVRNSAATIFPISEGYLKETTPEMEK